MTGNLKLLINFLWKFLGTVRFWNDHVAAILGFGDLQWGNIVITRVYFVEGLGHNLFSVGQFCDSDLEVAFRRNACFQKSISSTKTSSKLEEEIASSSYGFVWTNERKLDISFLYVFGALCYPKNDHEDIGKLGAKSDIGFFISSKPGLQSMTPGQISLGLDLTYAPSTITTQQPTEGELDLLFEAMYDDYIGGQPSATERTFSP
nr:integrase, catalytic region, zinc finger, CCHC-type, peptidase aspartic, catalytic [Tanacetum cinerariifolium]